VLRLLAAAKPMALAKIGLPPLALTRLRAMAERPYGLILVCGPTGSGKTTTLHSVLAHLNTPETKIWTAEDPIEITQPGLTQVQMQPHIGWTFATALRAFLRADPDVIMVGEVRDAETARIVVEASLTGHLVLTTLHTNSAPESVTRLIDIGIDPFNFADALLGVLAQRLTRRLCMRCRQLEPGSADTVQELAKEYCAGTTLLPDAQVSRWTNDYAVDGQLRIARPVGCKACSGTGFTGRIAIYELLEATPAIKRLMLQHESAEKLAAQGLADGMRTLKQDGIEKMLQGLTTIEQIRAVSN
jgi:type II secretory ATPase GspE/PulE/Tfp pilus assembly ATPase PilB-like protein